MEEIEIVNSYKTAANPAKQIKVLAELNATTKLEIRKVLIRRDVMSDSMSGGHGNSLSEKEEKERLRLYAEGLNDREMADRLHYSKQCVFSWRKRRGLPANYRRGDK